MRKCDLIMKMHVERSGRNSEKAWVRHYCEGFEFLDLTKILIGYPSAVV